MSDAGQGWLDRLRGGLGRSSAKLTGGITGLFTKRKLDRAALDELEEMLIAGDLGVATAGKLKESLAKRRLDKEVTPEEVKTLLADEIAFMLDPVARPLVIDPVARPFVVLVCGVNGSAATGKPVAGFSIEQKGDFETIRQASWKAKEFVHWATELQKEVCPLTDLWVSTKCGESDTTTGLGSCPTVGNMYDKLIPHGLYGVFGETTEITGAEHLCKARAATPEAGEKFMKLFQAYQDDVIEPFKTSDLSDSQPTKGNILGGLTTIEEKALGNLEKIGRTSTYIDALEPAEAPAQGPGLYYMDTSSAAAECVTLMAAAGYVVHTFPTGQGNVVGNPILPVIKISANPRTLRTMGEHIDVDVTGILKREMTMDQAGDALIEMIIRTANGRSTAAEALGHREFVMTKLYRSA